MVAKVISALKVIRGRQSFWESGNRGNRFYTQLKRAYVSHYKILVIRFQPVSQLSTYIFDSSFSWWYL